MMRLYPLFILMFLACSQVKAQVVLGTNTLPKPTDEFDFTAFSGYEDTLSFQTNGEDVEWNFSSFNITNTVTENYLDPNGTELIDSFPETNIAFELGPFAAAGLRTDTTLEVIGIFASGFAGFEVDAAVNFDDNYLVQRRPMVFGDSYEDDYNIEIGISAAELGLDSLEIGFPGAILDSVKIQTQNSYVEEAVGWGLANIEGSAHEVLKVLRTETSNTNIEIGLLVFDQPLWLNATELFPDAEEFAGEQSFVTHRFLEPDTKWALAEFRVNRFPDTLGVEQVSVTGRIRGDILSSIKPELNISESLLVLPNPIENSFIIKADGVISTSPATAIIYNLKGQRVSG